MSSFRALSNLFWVCKEKYLLLVIKSYIYVGFNVQKARNMTEISRYNKVKKHFVCSEQENIFQASRVDFFINQMSSNNQRKNTLSHYPAKSPSPRPTASYILEKIYKKQSTCTLYSIERYNCITSITVSLLVL